MRTMTSRIVIALATGTTLAIAPGCEVMNRMEQMTGVNRETQVAAAIALTAFAVHTLDAQRRAEVQSRSPEIVREAERNPNYGPDDTVILTPTERRRDGSVEYAVVKPSPTGGEPTVAEESVVLDREQVREMERRGDGVLDARDEPDLPVIGGKKVVFAS